MAYRHHRQWAKFMAGVATMSVLATTCTPVCGSTLDVDSTSCCQRHGCIPAEPGAATPGTSESHALMVMAPASSDSLAFDTDGCCQEGALLYPTAQLRAAGVDGSVPQIAVGLVVRISQSVPRFGKETATRSFASSPSPPLYRLHATFRI